jgi:GDP-mannose 6-dehydrogenase
MRVGVFGLGYVGCVSAACLARDGHHVVGVDNVRHKVDQVNSGVSPILERGLAELIEEVVESGRLVATAVTADAIMTTDVSLICVGTPSNANGSLRTEYVEGVCREIGVALAIKRAYHVVVVRSTVLPTLVRQTLIPLLEEHSGLKAGVNFGVCVNPEFLREGTAIRDYDRPSFIIVGATDDRAAAEISRLYEGIVAPTFRTSIEAAAMVKYASNAFHALKISFANEIGNLSKTFGLDGREVMQLLVEDRELNVSAAYLRPGFAFGGSCLPKDLKAMLYAGRSHDVPLPLLDSVLESNERQIRRGVAMVEATGCSSVGILGLSFKAGTDDIRASPAIALIEALIGKGYQVKIFDESVRRENLVGANRAVYEQRLAHIAAIMCPTVEDLFDGVEVVVLTNNAEASGRLRELISPGQRVLDLSGAIVSVEQGTEWYEGICW